MKKVLVKVGILAFVLVFGMMVVGCDDGSTDDNKKEKDTTPATPTGLSGTADGNSVQLTWQSVANASEYLLEFKKEYDSSYQAVNNITSTSYTVTGLDSNKTYKFRVAAQNTKGDKSGFSFDISVTTSNPKTGTVSLKSLSTTHRVITVSGVQNHSYTITAELELSNGSFWKWESSDNSVVYSKVQTWVTLTPPSGFSFDNTSVGIGSSESKTIRVRYQSLLNDNALPVPNLTATIDQSKLSEMKGYTNITDTLTLGTPSTASSNAWVDSN
jgi:hypothetical protein